MTGPFHYGDVVRLTDATGSALLMILRPATSLDFGYHTIPADHLHGRYVSMILSGTTEYKGRMREAGFIGPVTEDHVLPADE